MRKLGLGNPFSSPKAATAPVKAAPTPIAAKPTTPRATQRSKSSIPMTGEATTIKRETKPYWVKWVFKNGEPYRLWIPSFLRSDPYSNPLHQTFIEDPPDRTTSFVRFAGISFEMDKLIRHKRALRECPHDACRRRQKQSGSDRLPLTS
jgi:hypothetical protein